MSARRALYRRRTVGQEIMMSNALFVLAKVRGIVREDGDFFIAGYPRLEVYSQGDSVEEAKENARDALRLWLESCLDRETLGDALVELGWQRSHEPAEPEGVEAESIHVVHLDDALGEPWEDEITIPAFQAAELLAAHA